MHDLSTVPWAEITALMQAIASLAWPALALVLVILFVKDIKALIPRVSSWEALGVKVKLTKQLDRLATATESLPIGRGARPLRGGRRSGAVSWVNPETLTMALRGSGTTNESPKETLLLVSTLIEDQLRRALERTGIRAETVAKQSWPEVMRRLREGGGVPASVLDSAAAFREVRNEIVHGRGVDEHDVFRAIDIGDRILNALWELPGAQEPLEEPLKEDPV